MSSLDISPCPLSEDLSSEYITRSKSGDKNLSYNLFTMDVLSLGLVQDSEGSQLRGSMMTMIIESQQ